jgi:hypothetical protein
LLQDKNGVYNIIDFGAIGDRLTDDTDAFQISENSGNP